MPAPFAVRPFDWQPPRIGVFRAYLKFQKRAVQFILLSFCGALLLGPLSLLQLGAWSWMLFKYSHDSGLSVAIGETFSGERPCGLCSLLEASSSDEATIPTEASNGEREFKLLAPTSTSLSFKSDFRHHASYFYHDGLPDSAWYEVLLPPPKLAKFCFSNPLNSAA